MVDYHGTFRELLMKLRMPSFQIGVKGCVSQDKGFPRQSLWVVGRKLSPLSRGRQGQHSTLQPGLPATDWACSRWVGHIAFPPLSRATFNPCLWSSCNWVGHIAVRWRPITSRVSKPNLAWSRIAWSATAHAPLDRLISVWWDFVQNLYIDHVITL